MTQVITLTDGDDFYDFAAENDAVVIFCGGGNDLVTGDAGEAIFYRQGDGLLLQRSRLQ